MQNQPNITLSQLADYLEKGKFIHSNFDFSTRNSYPALAIPHKFIPNCGTSGCAMGELPALDSRFTFEKWGSMLFIGKPTNVTTTAKYFGVSDIVIHHLFYPESQNVAKFGGYVLDDFATKEEVLYNLREYLKIYGEPQSTNN